MKSPRINSTISSSLIAFALAIGSLAIPQSATAQDGTALGKATIPFAFQMDKQSLPAGTYRIERVSSHIVRLRGSSHQIGTVITNSAYRTHVADRGTLVFDHYGNKYFLRQVWTAESSEGMQCPKGRAEKEMLQARNNTSSDSTELAFNSIPPR